MDSMDKRTLIAVVLALVVLIGYQFLFTKPETQRPQTEAPKTEQAKKETPTPVVPPPVVETGTPAREVKVETELYIATFTSKGGTVKSFELKKYKNRENTNVSLLKTQGVYPPLALGTTADDFGLSQMDFAVKGSDLRLKEKEAGSFSFEYSAPQFSVRRTYTFYADRYRFDLKDEVTGLPEYWLALGSDFGIYDRKDSTAPHIGPVILKDSDRIEWTAQKLNEPKSYKEGLHWIAQEDKYFFASIVPAGKAVEVRAWKKGDSDTVAFRVASGVNDFMIYAGPKEYDRLKELNAGLEHIIDFGFFSIVARPLFWILKLFYSFLGNYGWAIVLLTIIVRIPFIPLINKGQKSMKRLQELQPKLNEIREKHKKDPQRMQKEMMEMYKKHKVNPMGGCLPMLLQIPVFFALYKVLMIAIELRGAPFMFWIGDLSEPDTLFGHIPSWFPLIGGFALGPLPIIMGVTMIVQQRMTPTSLDPKQNQIMMLMPVIFTFLFLNFASGLVLYWLVNNLLSIGQQFYTNSKLSKQVA